MLYTYNYNKAKERIQHMKKTVFTIAAAIFTLVLSTVIYADTIITVPIDGRPISDEYLENLVKIGGDKYISVDKKNMDFFSSYEPDNHLGNSKAIREELYNIVSQNNNEYTTVIINTSSYITNGLVGSRCGINYDDTKAAIEDLHRLITDFPEPKYYVNLSMPRSLPETRFNKIWCDNEKLKGLAAYYLEENPDCADYDEISQKYSQVTPIQYIMEFSYVDSKAAELGEDKLTDWERNFLHYFNRNIKTKEPYRQYVEYYKKPYSLTAGIFSTLLKWHKAGELDEIIVSNDDLQVPDFITYMSQKKADWIQTKNNSPVKYSYARQYMETSPSSVQKELSAVYGKKEIGRAAAGNGKSINIIYGTDEIPQLIYARDYVQRKNRTANISITYNDVTQNVATFDVIQPGNITRTALNFTKGNVGSYTTKKLDMYVYDYKMSKDTSQDILAKMEKSYKKGNSVGLIELFSGTKDNTLFKTMRNRKELGMLCAYSAWNTNANALGLGIAHAQVYAAANECTNSPSTSLEAQLNMLLQHLIEDGIYTKSGKLALSNKGYRPNVEDRTHSQMLCDILETDSITDNLKAMDYSFKGVKYRLENAEVERTSFPWGRTFDIFIESNIEVKKAAATAAAQTVKKSKI